MPATKPRHPHDMSRDELDAALHAAWTKRATARPAKREAIGYVMDVLLEELHQRRATPDAADPPTTSTSATDTQHAEPAI